MSGISKLRGVVHKSTLLEKDTLTSAIDKCLVSPARKKSTIEPLLAFGSKKLGASKLKQEDEFRMYARLAILLAGYVLNPPRMDDVNAMRERFVGKDYGNVGAAKQEYQRYKHVAWCVQKEYPVAILNVGDFVTATNLSEGVVLERIVNACFVAIATLERVVAALTSLNKDVLALMVRWFGGGRENAAAVLQSYQRLLERLRSTQRPLRIDYEPKDVWGCSVAGNGVWITLGKKFFDDEQTLPFNSTAWSFVATESDTRSAKSIGSDYGALKAEKYLLELLENEFKYAQGNVGDNLDDYATTALQARKTETKAAILKEAVDALESINVLKTTTCKAALVAITRRFEAIKQEQTRLASAYGDFEKGSITAYGTIIHEAAHMQLDADDYEATHAGFAVPGIKCYGPLLCQMLATERMDLARKNADNFRQFAECFGPDL